MAEYKCFSCNKTLESQQIKRRIRCIYCGSKILYKKRTVSTIIEAV